MKHILLIEYKMLTPSFERFLFNFHIVEENEKRIIWLIHMKNVN